jgi:putative PIN family toxin of toxin-antitoxin system
MTSAAIIDTNVVVAGLLTARPESPVVRILDRMVAGAWPFVLSEALLAEYSAVLVRPKLRKAHGLSDQEIDAILIEITQHAIVLAPPPAREKAPDPDDQHLWDLLHAREDLLLVTGDLELHATTGMATRILSLATFVERWRTA